MSTDVSTLAILAKTDKTQLESLWNATYKLIALWAQKYRPTQGSRLYELDDLYQSAYLALYDAAQTYDPDRGCEFTTHLLYKVRSRFAEVIGRRGTKIHPEINAVSLDEPLRDEADSGALVDMIEDPTAEFADRIIEDETTRQDFTAIIQDIEKLPELQRRALMLTAYDGLSYVQAGELIGTSRQNVHGARCNAVRTLRRTRTGSLMSRQRAWESFHHITLSQYRRTGISAAESAVLNCEWSSMD